MASGRLGAHISSSASTTSVYNVPTGKTAEVNVTVYNNSGLVNKVSLFRSPTGTPSATHTVQLDTIGITEGYERTAFIMKAGEHLCYKTDQAGTNVVVTGVEYDSLANEIHNQVLISTNTETTVFNNTAVKAGTVNISISLADGSAVSDTATVALYTSTSNATSGYILHKKVLTTTDISGFEKTGFAISTTDKIIVVTTGLVGQVAVTVSGYSKG